MRRLPKARAAGLACFLAIASGIAGCQHVGATSGNAIEKYAADDIDVDTGTVKGRSIATLQDVQVELRGLVKARSGGSPVMYLSHDRKALDVEYSENCIHLIVDRKLQFRSPAVADYIVIGAFILVDRPDAETVYLTYQGIRFDTDCQAFAKPDRYPYFVVESFRKAN